MKKIIFYSLILCYIFQIGCKDATLVNKMERLQPEQIFIKDFPRPEILKHLRDNVYSFTFIEDSIPYIDGEDSLFQIVLKDKTSILYYNSSMYRNTAFIILGDLDGKEFKLFTTNTIMKASAYYLNNKNVLFEIEEFIHPLISQNSYFLLPPLLSESDKIYNISSLSKGSYWLPDSTGVFSEFIDVHLQDSVSNSSIYIKGLLKGDYIIDSVMVRDRGFIISDYLRKLQWDSINILQSQIINQQIIHSK